MIILRGRRSLLLSAARGRWWIASWIALCACGSAIDPSDAGPMHPLDASWPANALFNDATEASMPADLDAASDARAADSGLDNGREPDSNNAALEHCGASERAIDGGCADAGSAGAVCHASRDCPAGELCGDVAVNRRAQWSTACWPAFGGGRAAGDPCTKDDDCASRFCSDRLAACAEVCTTSADCPLGLACVGFDFTLSAGDLVKDDQWLHVCSRACANDTSCQRANPGTVCMFQSFQTSTARDALAPICLPPSGADPVGTPTFDGENCKNHLIARSSIGLFCSAPCASDADCREGAASGNPLVHCNPNTGLDTNGGDHYDVTSCGL